MVAKSLAKSKWVLDRAWRTGNLIFLQSLNPWLPQITCFVLHRSSRLHQKKKIQLQKITESSKFFIFLLSKIEIIRSKMSASYFPTSSAESLPYDFIFSANATFRWILSPSSLVIEDDCWPDVAQVLHLPASEKWKDNIWQTDENSIETSYNCKWQKPNQVKQDKILALILYMTRQICIVQVENYHFLQ